MINSILLDKIEKWWESLDSSERLDIVMSDPEIDEIRLSYKYENGIPSGDAYDDSIDNDDFVSSYWSGCDDESKLDIYNKWKLPNESKSTVLDFESFIKENYKH